MTPKKVTTRRLEKRERAAQLERTIGGIAHGPRELGRIDGS
jgi:hypothetical protein